MRRARAVALSFLAAGVLASSAHAAEPTRVAEFVQGWDRDEAPFMMPTVGDVALAGSRAVWTRRLLDGSWRVQMAAPGERVSDLAKSPRVLPGIHTLGPFGSLAPGLAASPQRVVWNDFAGHQTVRSFFATTQDRLLTASARPGSPVEALGCSSIARCPPPCRDCFTGSRHFAAVDGDTVAFADHASHVVTIHRAGAADVQIQTGSKPFYGLGRLAIGGRFVAWQDLPVGFAPGVVYDWQAGRAVFQIPAGEIIGGIQADGKLLTHTATALRWRALPDETPHDIPNPSPTDEPIGGAQLSGDRIAFFTGASSSTRRPLTLWVADLDGHAHVVAEGAWGPAYAGPRESLHPSGFGFDGRRLAWMSQPCGVATVMLADDAATAVSPPQPRCAAPRIEDVNGTARFTKTIRRDGRAGLAVRLTCPSGCRGRIEVTFLDNVPLTTVGARTVDLPAGDQATTVHVRPSKRAARLLQKHRIVERETFGTVYDYDVSIALLARDRNGERVGATTIGNVCRKHKDCPIPSDVHAD